MKKLILALLIASPVLAISESPTDQGTDTQCMHKGFYEDQKEIDQMIAQGTTNPKVEESKTISR